MNTLLLRYLSVVVLLVAGLAGCSQQPSIEPDEDYKVISTDQLVPTLRQIEETGEYHSVLSGLSGGLEQAGFMNEAAQIQSFTELPDDKIKKLAGAIATLVEKTQKANP